MLSLARMLPKGSKERVSLLKGITRWAVEEQEQEVRGQGQGRLKTAASCSASLDIRQWLVNQLPMCFQVSSNDKYSRQKLRRGLLPHSSLSRPLSCKSLWAGLESQ